MDQKSRIRRAIAAPIMAATMLSGATAAHAVNIPEGGAVTPDSVLIINFQIIEGCDGQATDGLVVTLPDSVSNPIPEAVAGWTAAVAATLDNDGNDAQTQVSWSGGPLADGQLLEFGLRLRFPDEEGAVLEFPVTQTCGLVDVVWSGSDGPTPAPKVVLQERLTATDLLELQATVQDIDTRLADVEARLGGVDPQNLRSRVSETESAIEGLTEDVADLDGRLANVEEPSEG